MDKKPLHILVVDDDINFTLTLSEILRTEGYSCSEAHSMVEAQELLSVENFDCVLSDIRMPNHSGPDLYYKIKKDQPDIPFILMTAYTSTEIIDEALESGVLAALSKPVDIKLILDFLSKLCQGPEAALICDQQKSCKVLSKILERKKFSFTTFSSINDLLQSQTTKYSVVFIDAHYNCDQYLSKIIFLLETLPQKTVVVICDYGKRQDSSMDHSLPQNLNLIILPRKGQIKNKIDKILQREIYQYAKQSIH